jgi:hypothetical protein
VTSRQELDNLRAVIERDLKDAALPGLSPDRTFATAYNAALQLAKIAIACAGYRIAFGPGHHQMTFEAVKLIALGRNSSKLADYFDICRRKRNVVDYDMANVTSETEANELLQKAEEFRQLVEAWIKQHHPNLAP